MEDTCYESPCAYPPAKAGHMAERRMGVEYSPSVLEPVRPGAVSPDRASCLPTFSHFLIVNKTSLFISLSLTQYPLPPPAKIIPDKSDTDAARDFVEAKMEPTSSNVCISTRASALAAASLAAAARWTFAAASASAKAA